MDKRATPLSMTSMPYRAQVADVFGVGIVGAGFSSGTGVFVQYKAVTEVCGVFFLKKGREVWVKGGTDIRGKHFAVSKRAAKTKL